MEPANKVSKAALYIATLESTLYHTEGKAYNDIPFTGPFSKHFIVLVTEIRNFIHNPIESRG